MAQPSLVRQRPVAVSVLAILHLVGGGIGLMLGLCGIAGQVLTQQLLAMGSFGPTPNSQKAFLDDLMLIPGYQAAIWTDLISGLILSLLLVIGGIGLLGVRPWGRTLSLIYAPLSILNRIGLLVWNLAVIFPATAAVFEKQAVNNPMFRTAAFSAKFSLILQVGWAIIALSYPIAVLIILNLPHVKAAFQGQTEAPPPSLPDDEGWGPMKPPGGSTDVTTQPDRDRFQPPT